MRCRCRPYCLAVEHACLTAGGAQGLAAEAYANRDFQETVRLLSELIAREPDSPRWFEMRAQARA